MKIYDYSIVDRNGKEISLGEIMKKVLISICVLLITIIITGCGKSNNLTHTCIKKDVEQTNSVTGDKYKEDYKYVAVLDSDEKLVHYTMDTIIYYETEEKCEDGCRISTNWNNEINEKKYTGFEKITKCDCKGHKSVQQISEYDIANLDKFLRSDIKEMANDNTFALSIWTSKYERLDYKCD